MNAAFDGAAAIGAADGLSGRPAALSRQLLNFVLFVTVLTSSLAFIEPSPHDALIFVLGAMCVGARIVFDRRLVPLLFLLIVWLIGGLMSLTQVGDDSKAIQYAGTSVYLCIAAVLFACLFSTGDLVRLAILRRGYILAALLATAAGLIGFFHLLPGFGMFVDIGRIHATFKDPNVYGPFLIFPLILLVTRLLMRGIRLLTLATMAALLAGLLLSFSRGAWLHFALSAAVCILFLIAATPDGRTRRRIVLLALGAAAAVALLVLVLVSLDSTHDMFVERAKVVQPYDVGPGGRFWDQQIALGAILDNPNGLGPFQFYAQYGMQQHNVYMQAFLVYGWLGGGAYLALVAVTLAVGLRTVLVRTPWQFYLIAAFATFVGEAVEGAIVDTDHWRHFFLVLGLIWGLAVATINERQSRALAVDAGRDTAPAIP